MSPAGTSNSRRMARPCSSGFHEDRGGTKYLGQNTVVILGTSGQNNHDLSDELRAAGDL